MVGNRASRATPWVIDGHETPVEGRAPEPPSTGRGDQTRIPTHSVVPALRAGGKKGVSASSRPGPRLLPATTAFPTRDGHGVCGGTQKLREGSDLE